MGDQLAQSMAMMNQDFLTAQKLQAEEDFANQQNDDEYDEEEEAPPQPVIQNNSQPKQSSAEVP